MTIANDSRIEITVSGAVHKMGRHVLAPPVSISDAITAAGGLSIEDSMRPSGVVTVRRPLPDKKVDVRQFDLGALPSAEECELKQGDLVVFQWDVDLIKQPIEK